MTGNFARPAQIKLEYFDLWRYFHFGAYGDDAPTRDDLVPRAVERARLAGAEVAAARQEARRGSVTREHGRAETHGAGGAAEAAGAAGRWS